MTAPDRGAGLTAGRRRKWTYAHDGHGAFTIETDDCDGEQICFVREEAHARLIAAAPTMLAALRPFADFVLPPSLERAPDETPLYTTYIAGKDTEITVGDLKRARAVITLATGSAS